jgi:hypothetical protein
MPYYKSAFKIKSTSSVLKVLSAFAHEQLNANQAHPINSPHFNIYFSLNDLQAIRQDNESVYGLLSISMLLTVWKAKSKHLLKTMMLSVNCFILRALGSKDMVD